LIIRKDPVVQRQFQRITGTIIAKTPVGSAKPFQKRITVNINKLEIYQAL
jgi:hypothetical protein